MSKNEIMPGYERLSDFSGKELVEIRRRASAMARGMPFFEQGLDEVFRQAYLELGRAAAVLKECIEWHRMREELAEMIKAKRQGEAHEQSNSTG